MMLADLPGRGLDPAHGIHGLRDNLAGFEAARLACTATCRASSARFDEVATLDGDLVERRGGVLERCGLLLGAPRQVVGAGGDLVRPVGDADHAAGHRRQRLVELRDRRVEIHTELVEVRRQLLIQTDLQIVLGQGRETAAQHGDRFAALPLVLGSLFLEDSLLVNVIERTARPNGLAVGLVAAAARCAEPAVASVAHLEAVLHLVARAAGLVLQVVAEGLEGPRDIVRVQAVGPGLPSHSGNQRRSKSR